MNTEQIRKYVLDYLEATECHIMELSPASVTVKLSERADRKLTNRPYYWGFVDRTGAEPETMRFTFVFDPSAMPPDPPRGPYAPPPAGVAPAPPAATVNAPQMGSDANPNAGDSILGRYFGVAPAFTGGGGGIGRIPREDVTFGSRRLSSIMQAAHEEGRFISLFADHAGNQTAVRSPRGTKRSTAYEPWLLMNLNVEFACDLKREEIHSYGISLVSGRIRSDFMEQLLSISLSPKLPSNVHVAPWSLSIEQAREAVEQQLIKLISTYDHTWAVEAAERLNEELVRLQSYYEPQLQQSGAQSEIDSGTSTNKKRQETIQAASNPESEDSSQRSKQEVIKQQYDMRCQEIRWQFEPRITVHLLNAGLIHLPSTMA
ncbi:YqhG family protein [Paenibacillus sp.]|uniref:YqhG family protein n=1 Tax=Paenibacillus sp. TaxID=58172 RepID=UPI003463A1F5